MPSTQCPHPKEQSINADLIVEKIKVKPFDNIHIKGKRVRGHLCIDSFDSKASIRFENCVFEEDISISKSNFTSLEIVNCEIRQQFPNQNPPTINIFKSYLSSLSIVDCYIDGGVSLSETNIAGNIDLGQTTSPWNYFSSIELGGQLNLEETHADCIEITDSVFNAPLDCNPGFGDVILPAFTFRHIYIAKFYNCTFNDVVDIYLGRNDFVAVAFSLSFQPPSCTFQNCIFKSHLQISSHADSLIKVLECNIQGTFLLPYLKSVKAGYPDYDGKFPLDISGSTIKEMLMCTGDVHNQLGNTVNTVPVTANFPVHINGFSISDYESFSDFDTTPDELSRSRTLPPFKSESKDFYNSLECLISHVPKEERYSPYFTIAISNACKQAGMNTEAEWLQYKGADLQLKARRGFSRKVWYYLSKFTIGHGFYLTRAVGLLLLTWVITSLVVECSTGSFHPAGDAPPNVPGFWGFLYALDVVASPVGTGQSELWIPGNWCLALALWTLKLLALGLGAMFLAGVTGVANKGLVGIDRNGQSYPS